jgi:hypothetical protein
MIVKLIKQRNKMQFIDKEWVKISDKEGGELKPRRWHVEMWTNKKTLQIFVKEEGDEVLKNYKNLELFNLEVKSLIEFYLW